MAESPINQDDTPTRMLDEDGIFARLRAWFTDDWDHHREWMDEAEEDFDFVASRQWSEEDIRQLEDQGRPASVFNRVAPLIDSVTGFEVANRQEVRYIPRQVGASGVNEMLTSAAAWFRDQTDAEDEESDAFRDAAIAGLGWTESRVDYESAPNGDPRIERIDPLSICADKDARKPNLVDAKRVWRLRKMDRDEAAALFPEADPGDLNAGWATDEARSRNINRPDDDYDHDDPATREEPECTVVECQWWEREPFVRFLDGMTGEEVEVSLEQFETIMARMEQIGPEQMMMLGIAPPTQVVTQYRRVYRRAFIGGQLLEVGNTPIDGHFSYKAITGKRDQRTGHFYGLVRTMKDPQRWTNKLFSQIMHILNSNAKGGIMAERGTFEDDRQAADDYARADGIVFTNPGAITNGKIQPKPPTPFPQGQAEMLQFAMGAMPLVTGVNMEFLGMREANQPGVLEFQRRQAGVTILATLFDSLRRYRKDQGRLMLRLIQEYLADGRLVRIVGEQQAQFVPLSRDIALGEYEVIVDDAPTSPNSKEKNWGIIQQMIPMMQGAMTPQLMAELARYSPLPDSINEIIRTTLTQPPPPPPPEAQVAQQLEMAEKLADIDFDAARAEKARADALARQAATMSELAPYMQMASPNLPPAAVPSGMIPGLDIQPGMATPDPQQIAAILAQGQQPQQMPQGQPGSVPPGNGPGMSQPPMPNVPRSMGPRGPGMPGGA